MSRTIVNSSDGLNSWDIEQSTSTATNTGIVETVIAGINESELWLDSESTSVVNNTGIVERPITGVSDGLNSWDIEQSTGTTNSTTTIRYINPPTIIPNLLSLLQARATYYENVTCTTAILTELENIEI